MQADLGRDADLDLQALPLVFATLRSALVSVTALGCIERDRHFRPQRPWKDDSAGGFGIV
jgi:hypothetical protein